MTPFFSIITPTLQRDSLVRCCQSIDSQTFYNWQHIVIIDASNINREMSLRIKRDNESDRRWIVNCGIRHNNYGNSCRNQAWAGALGEWVLFCDDDNYLAHDNVLQDIHDALKDVEEKWAIFPIMRHGHPFFYDPPGCCYVDTANMVIRREIAQWPDGPEYTMDGIFCDKLKEQYPYKAFPSVSPIVVMESSNQGR